MQLFETSRREKSTVFADGGLNSPLTLRIKPRFGITWKKGRGYRGTPPGPHRFLSDIFLYGSGRTDHFGICNQERTERRRIFGWRGRSEG